MRRVARETMAAMPAHLHTQTAARGTWPWLAELIFSCLLLVLRMVGAKTWEDLSKAMFGRLRTEVVT